MKGYFFEPRSFESEVPYGKSTHSRNSSRSSECSLLAYARKKAAGVRHEPLRPLNVPGGIRTCDLRFRKPTLYPAELRGHQYTRFKCAAVWYEMGSARPIDCLRRRFMVDVRSRGQTENRARKTRHHPRTVRSTGWGGWPPFVEVPCHRREVCRPQCVVARLSPR